jgi:hypothetical protein
MPDKIQKASKEAVVLTMVRSVDKRWNSLYPDILRLVQGLERLGLEYHNGVVSYASLDDGNV